MHDQSVIAAEGVSRRAVQEKTFPLNNGLDVWLIAGAVLHGVVLVSFPSIVTVALGMWWNANTVSHYFIHRPFFRTRRQNQIFSAALTLLLGLPQQLWRQRHLAHHRESKSRLQLNAQLAIETGLLLAFWGILFTNARTFFFGAYLPGWLLGLGLCQLHGYFEHYRGTVSHYGRLYNLLFFNDGFHEEHHRKPGEHWSLLPATVQSGNTQTSTWPAVLRFLDYLSLDGLERHVTGSTILQKWIIGVHKRAITKALRHVSKPRTICVVGGGIFPRTALVLRELFPDAKFWIMDRSASNLEEAKRWLKNPATFIAETYDPDRDSNFDLVTIPLAYRGNREDLYQRRSGSALLIHDWIWRRRGRGLVVSWLLLKRINLVTT